ncbi:MAG TPA: ATP-binding cassette domain-containing protein, partial [archaeon]|nr:ATP-binding cassette domain-containing protein [archaeon]
MALTFFQTRGQIEISEEEPRGVSMDAISVRDLSKGYSCRSGSMDALHEISFSVKEGEFVAIVGPSGCGKSTLL